MVSIRNDFRAALRRIEDDLRSSTTEGRGGEIYTPKQVVGIACGILLDTLLNSQSFIQTGVTSAVRQHALGPVEARILGEAITDVMEVVRGKARNAPS